MRLLVFDRTGQVATKLARRVPDARFVGREMANLSDPAAWTAVDATEAQEAEAHVINAETPGAMAWVAAASALPFLHVSTDYFFDGSGAASWRETDPALTRNACGRTKLAGEAAVRAAGGPHAILRTSWICSAHGANFVKPMLRLSEPREHFTVVEDQVGGPTLAADIARAGRQVEVTGIPTRDYRTPAVRPPNWWLGCAAIGSDFGIAPPDWRQPLDLVLKELNA